jgi:hypothetical protein
MTVRLKYYVFLTDKNKIERSKEGVQQGGIDSPYLWNIYMYEFDQYVHNHLNSMFPLINKKVLTNKKLKKIVTRQHGKLFNKMRKTKEKYIRSLKQDELTKQEKYQTIRKIRLVNHQRRKLPDVHPNKKELRFLYVRYADDWILLINGTKMLAEKIKESITTFLREELKATLSLILIKEKTLITDLTNPNTPAHFLGFEITCPCFAQTRKYSYKRVFQISKKYFKKILSKTSGWRIKIFPDRQRLINRFYMKGFCNKKGFPISIPWLAPFEPYVIIQKFNAVLAGLSNFYTEFIYNKNKINRWIYIIRFSCLKTLAQKYKTTITGIFRRFAKKDENNDDFRRKFGKTIEIKVQLKVKNEIFFKKFHLKTYIELLENSIKLDRKQILKEKFLRLENPTSPSDLATNTINRIKGRIPKITDEDYLEQIKWVSWRTQASLGMPCSLCGTTKNVQMHHLKHVRKNTYSAIPSERTWEQIMNLRNRKQIPVCAKKTPAIWESSTKEDTVGPNL